MNLITCPACQKQISPEAAHCPACGQPIVAAHSKRFWQAVIVLAGLGLFAWLYHYRMESLVTALGGTPLPDLMSGLKK